MRHPHPFRRVAAGLAGAAALSVALAACSSGAPGASSTEDADPSSFTVAFVPGSTGSQFYVTMQAGAEAAAEEAGIDLVFQGADEFSPDAQTPIINALAARAPDVLIVAPTDGTSMFAPINALAQAGTRIITVDTTLEDDSIVDAAIGASNAQGGKLAADIVAEQTGGSGTAAVLGLNPGATTINERSDGFTEALAEAAPDMKVLPTEYASGTDPADAQTKTEALLLAHPDITAIFAPNQPAGVGAAAALRAQGRDDVVLVGYDSSDAQVELVRSGAMYATILQQPYLEGELAVQTAVAILSDEDFEASQLLDNLVVTAENIDDPEVVSALY